MTSVALPPHLAVPHFSVISVITLLLALIVVWVIISIPAYIAGKLLVGNRATFGGAMLATLIGPIIFALVLLVGAVLTLPFGGFIALFLAFLAWIWVYKETFHTGWLHGFAIAILSALIAVILVVILGVVGIALLAL